MKKQLIGIDLATKGSSDKDVQVTIQKNYNDVFIVVEMHN